KSWDQSCAYIFIKDTDLNYVWLNSSCLKMMGIENSQSARGQNDFVFFDHDFAAGSQKCELDLIRSVKPSSSMHEKILCPDGRERWLYISRSPLMKDAVVCAIIGIMTDITSLKQEQTTLPEEKNLYEDLFENAPNIIVTADPEGNITKFNKKARKMIQKYGDNLADEATGKNLLHYAHKADVDKFIHAWKQNLAGKTVEYEGRLIGKDGRVVHILASGRPIIKNGKVISLHYQALDITDHKTRENVLHQASSMEAIGRLSGSIAHDFNNLLTVINGYSELIINSIDQANPLYGKIKQIHQAGQKASDMTGKILEFSKKQKPESMASDINDILSSQEAIFQRLLGENIRLVFALDPLVEMINIDTTQLSQIVLNLIVNARDGMPMGGTVTVSTQETNIDISSESTYKNIPCGKYVILSIRDTGQGIKKETMKHIFEPFFSTKPDGAGIGLWTVKSIVKECHGEIRVNSEIGHGTTFDIFFPVNTTKRTFNAQTAPTQEKNTSAASIKKTILVTEDDDTVRELVTEILSQKGYTVLTARNGGDALQLARNHKEHVDMLLTDIVMRRIDGKMLSDKIIEIWPHIKVLFMSGYGHEVFTEEDFKSREFLQKPFLPDDLIRKVDAVLAKP
ncbi:MAG: PAS domain S-box protein, partial [Deltaproteobacteria bacterium]|nr:PAS domain S-box protein [Deltaproteobacteria bacterium]